jgi:hypothetical protein
MAASGALFLFRLAKLRRFLSRQLRLRSIGRARVLVTDETESPFSAWAFSAAFVVIPVRFLESRSELAIVLRHELQHLRSRDTHWLYLHELLKVAFFWNPAVRALARWIAEAQEFACDETLVGHQRVSPQAYGRCLLKAAETAVRAQSRWVGTAGMAAPRNGITLGRRIEMLFQYQEKPRRRTVAAVVFIGAMAVLSTLAYASRSAIQERGLTLQEAQALARKTGTGMKVPLDMNELVLAKLNRYVATAGGRKYVREAFERLPEYKAMIDKKTKEHGMPEELIALAMYESGFRNNLVSPPPHLAAGIWQFIPATARTFDLKVSDTVDERRDPEKETVAAMRFLSQLHDEFGDWRLAFKSYNEGPKRVAGLIEKHGTRDPWVLERADTRESYLSGVIAMMLIYRNPSLVD